MMGLSTLSDVLFTLYTTLAHLQAIQVLLIWPTGPRVLSVTEATASLVNLEPTLERKGRPL